MIYRGMCSDESGVDVQSNVSRALIALWTSADKVTSEMFQVSVAARVVVLL